MLYTMYLYINTYSTMRMMAVILCLVFVNFSIFVVHQIGAQKKTSKKNLLSKMIIIQWKEILLYLLLLLLLPPSSPLCFEHSTRVDDDNIFQSIKPCFFIIILYIIGKKNKKHFVIKKSKSYNFEEFNEEEKELNLFPRFNS